jgi:hypothetical protein
MATNAQRQAAFKAKMRQAGKKQMTIWADPEQQAAIMAFLAGTGSLPVMTLPSRPVRLPAASRGRKKRDTREAWQKKNDELWETHRTEITRYYAAGQKPSQIAAWLNTLGFTGSGATLNGYLKR